jgi:hypothetical protein
MRLPAVTTTAVRMTRRFILTQSPAGQKLGREITSGPPETLARHIRDISRFLGGSRKWQQTFFDGLTSWVLGEADHADTTSYLLGLEIEGGRIPEQLYLVAQTAAAVGLFEVSLAFEEQALEDIAWAPPTAKRVSDFIEHLQVSIHRRDMERARYYCDALVKLTPNLHGAPYSIRDLVNYAMVWTGQPSIPGLLADRGSAIDARWHQSLDGANVAVYGPGVVSHGHPKFRSADLIARIAGPGSYSWSDRSDLANARTDIVYMIPETLRAIGSTEVERQRALGGFRFVGVKREQPAYLPNARKVEAGSRLFLRGHPNMVPLICIDVIRLENTTAYVAGSDFFTSVTAYRENSRRVNADGARQTPQGSNGKRFDRTTLMASHNVLQNRRVVANLVESGRISGDSEFSAACALTDLEYARRLDFVYGKNKI